jgi:predicted NAD-dependent protein-ADP-ribosyltransferase YbiA (DUF1768 family)
MRIEQGVLIVDSTDDLLSSRFPAPFRVLHRQFMSAWHYVLYMKATRLQLYGTADSILAAKVPDELRALEDRTDQVDQGMWLQDAWYDMDIANRNKFHDNPDMLEFLLGTGTQLIVSTTHPETFWSAPVLARGERLSDKLTWIRRNTEGISLMRTRDEFAESRAPVPSSKDHDEPDSLRTNIKQCFAWDPEFSMVSRGTYDAWVDQIRALPSPEVVHELYAYMRREYWDVDTDHPGRFEFIRWVRSELGLELPQDPELLRGRQSF